MSSGMFLRSLIKLKSTTLEGHLSCDKLSFPRGPDLQGLYAGFTLESFGTLQSCKDWLCRKISCDRTMLTAMLIHAE